MFLPQVPQFFVYNGSHYMSGVMGLALFFRRLTHCRLWSDLEFETHLQVKEELSLISHLLYVV